LIKHIRSAIGFVLVGIAMIVRWPLFKASEFIAPWLDRGDDEDDEDEGDVLEPPPIPLKGKDLSSYLEELKARKDISGSVIAVCGDLKSASLAKKCAIKLNHASTIIYTNGVIESTECTTQVQGHNNDRWYRLKNLEMETPAMMRLVDEMVEVLAQDGWACPNDAAIQLFDFVERTLNEHHEYLAKRSATSGVSSKIRLRVSMVVNANTFEKDGGISPQISTKISIWPDITDASVECAHFVYFSQTKKKLQLS
jgi:hypothetical protein